ncbi:MAG TPA: ABC transporter permease [Thermoanaerobaculia bacterium]|nr:ABC transporter permease [Thermoanaerobaculia bacterium]
MKGLIKELRLAFRTLWRNPWLATTAALTLALGLGAVGAMLSVIKGVVLRPFPYQRPSELVMIWNSWQDFPKTWLSIPEFRAYREQTHGFADVALFWTEGVNLTGRGEPQRVGGGFVSPNVFKLLGVGPLLGRTFAWEDSKAGKRDVVVLGYDLWRRQYGGDGGIVGTNVEIDGKRKVVIGVMPAGFRLPLEFNSQKVSDLWLPIKEDLDVAPAIPRDGGDHSYVGVARLRPGVSAAQASAELRAMARRLMAEGVYPAAWHFTPLVIPVLEEILGSAREALFVLLAAVALVLLIACANVALLLLARGTQRRKELAIRAALGAQRAKLVRHMILESVALALLGWAGGVALARLALGLLVRNIGANIPRMADVALDGWVMFALLLIALLTAILIALPPVLHHSLIDPQSELKEAGRSGSLGSRRRHSQRALVAAEMALAMILVSGTGLMVRSFLNLLKVDVGVHPGNVLTMAVNPSSLQESDGARVPRYYQALLARIEQVPGVEKAAAVRLLPLASRMGDWGLRVEGYQPAPGERVKGDWQAVTPGYFEVMGIPLRRGRSFTAADRVDSQPVIIVNEEMVRKFWPHSDPIGKRVQVRGSDKPPWSTVVGVAGNVRHNSITEDAKEQWYLPDAQFHLSTGIAVPAKTLVIKTSLPPNQLVRPVRAAILSYDPKLPVSDVRDFGAVLAKAVSQPRITMLLMIVCAAIALVLAIVGTYGVVGYSVSQRTQEIGLRMALGAAPGKVLAMVMREGVTVSALGVVIGGVMATLLMQFMAGLLFGVHGLEPVVFVAGAVVLLLVAVGASFLPAWRARRIDPVDALRGE